MEEGSSWEIFDLISALKKKSIDKISHTAKENGSRSYKSRSSAKVNVKVMMTVTMRKKIFSKMGTKKDILLFLIPSNIIKSFFGS